MYEDWCRVIGGILGVIGKDEDLRSVVESQQGAATDTDTAIAPFLRAWWDSHGSADVGVQHLFVLAAATGSLDAILSVHLTDRELQRARGTETDRARQTRLGQALRRLAGQVHADYRIEPAGTDRSRRQLYRLHQMARES
jgi:hypothetical protein